MSTGDMISIDAGSNTETRRIATVGTAAGRNTALWQPLPDGPVITIPIGSNNVPVTSVSGFKVGEKIALGYGATYPAVGRDLERYEVATVTAVGKPGTQAYLAVDAHAGATNLQVTSVDNIAAGDRIRLDVDSVGHGSETVALTHVGTQATRGALSANASAGATHIRVHGIYGAAVGGKIIVGTPANKETVTITAFGASGQADAAVDFTPVLDRAHSAGESVVAPGTGLELAAPLKFNHAANLPFSDRGTGISFQPATAFAHSSNEPVQALGTGITLDRPLVYGHALDAVVRDTAVMTAGYQGTPVPNQWFGGPELTTYVDFFGRTLSLKEGSMVLRDASGLVVDSLNYGSLVDPWATEGYQATSGLGQNGCYAPAPDPPSEFGPYGPSTSATNMSTGRFPDGVDTGSNCTDFQTQTAATLSEPSVAGGTNIKVTSVAGFKAGQTITIDTGANLETTVIATVGTAGATTATAATDISATIIPVASAIGFRDGQTISLGSGANYETAVVVSANRWGTATITVAAPLTFAHAAGAQVSGTGITLTTALTHTHASGAQVADNLPTPGTPNRYRSAPH